MVQRYRYLVPSTTLAFLYMFRRRTSVGWSDDSNSLAMKVLVVSLLNRCRVQQKGERVEIYKMEKRVIDKAVKVGAASVETKVALSIMQRKCRKCILFASGTEKR